MKNTEKELDMRNIFSKATVAFDESSEQIWNQITGGLVDEFEPWIPGIARFDSIEKHSLQNGQFLICQDSSGKELRAVLEVYDMRRKSLTLMIEFSAKLRRSYRIELFRYDDTGIHGLHNITKVTINLDVKVQEGWRSATSSEEDHFSSFIRRFCRFHPSAKVDGANFD